MLVKIYDKLACSLSHTAIHDSHVIITDIYWQPKRRARDVNEYACFIEFPIDVVFEHILHFNGNQQVVRWNLGRKGKYSYWLLNDQSTSGVPFTNMDVLPSWIKDCIHYKVWDEISYPYEHMTRIHIPSYTLLGMWLLTHAGIRVNQC